MQSPLSGAWLNPGFILQQLMPREPPAQAQMLVELKHMRLTVEATPLHLSDLQKMGAVEITISHAVHTQQNPLEEQGAVRGRDV